MPSRQGRRRITGTVRAFQTCRFQPARIVHCWSILPRGSAPPTEAAGRRQLHERGFLSLMLLAQVLGDLQRIDTVQIVVVTDRLQEVVGETAVAPERATVFGPLTVIPQEYPHVRCRAIDVTPFELGSPEETRLLDDLVAEFDDHSPAFPVVAYRGGHRWVRTYEPYRLKSSPAALPQVRHGGTFLVTGGLGGIGLALAEHLARTAAAKLVLTGRSGLPPKDAWSQWLDTHEPTDETSRRIGKVQALEALGAEVLVVRADVCDLEQMRACLSAARARFGSIDGVIHSAGTPGGGMIQPPSAGGLSRRARAEGRGYERPHVAALWDVNGLRPAVLIRYRSPGRHWTGRLLRRECLSRCVRSRETHGRERPARDLRELGRLARGRDGCEQLPSPARCAPSAKEYIRNGILPAEGADAFARILASPLSEVVVSTRDWLAIMDLAHGHTESDAQKASATVQHARRPRPSRSDLRTHDRTLPHPSSPRGTTSSAR